MSDFCRQCGASFPPRDGEGICRDWQACRAKQDAPAPLEDIVVRLRKRAEIRRRIRSEGDRIARDLDEAATEIEQLRAALSRRRALDW